MNHAMEHLAKMVVSTGPCTFNFDLARSFNRGVATQAPFPNEDKTVDVHRTPSTECCTMKTEACTSFAKPGTRTVSVSSASA